MDCENCGAPTTLMEGRDYFTCGYCHAFHFPNELQLSADGVKPLDERSNLDCPVCTLHLSVGSVEGGRVQYCEKCRGMLAANEDFMVMMQYRRANQTGPPDKPTPLDREAMERKVSCPSCEKQMDVHPYYGPGNVVIDSCARCRVVWLDHGEFAAIGRAPGRDS